jgi:hypothetical protein
VIATIGGKIGRVHLATQHPGLKITRPAYAFVPEEFFRENIFDKARYLASRWPSANCTANPNGIGSHLLPDPEKPVSNRSRCPVLWEFIRRLETIATIKIPPT